VVARNNLKSGIKEFMGSEGPSFLEVITDINEVVYPKIPVSKGYKDMALRPYIQKAKL
jgi:acetolactate synthase-1/2/3 large subunit